MNELTQLNDRAKHLLRCLIERYISDGQPVGSRTLSRESGLALSAATIRNVMADLEAVGLVASPHTSAGRVPTAKGIRLFVDSMIAVKPMAKGCVAELRNRLVPGPSTSHELLESASELLSEMTNMAGVVLVPRRARFALRHVEFLSLSNHRILAVLVINEREVQNRVLQMERQYTDSELQQAANYLNTHFAGQDIITARDKLIGELRDARASMNDLMLATISLASSAFQPAKECDEVLIAGQANLMEAGGLTDLDQLRGLFEAFEKKRKLLGLLDRCLHADGLQIFIGKEAGQSVFDDCSVVTSTYAIDGQVAGVLGVIGPTRMDYKRVIPVVDATAKLLGSALNSD